MEIEIWSDILCPFCYIGKHTFEKALAQFAHQDKVHITWKSFQLDPDFRATAQVPYMAYLKNRKGWSETQILQITSQISERGKSIGLKFNFQEAVLANSHEAHRLLHYAKTLGKQHEVKECLFAAHFTEGKDIGDTKVLTDIAVSCGLDKEAVAQLWQTDAYSQEVDTDLYEAQQLGVRGVPFFVFNRKYAISGAQEVAAFQEVLEACLREENLNM